MDLALLSHEWRPYFAEYGPVIFDALKSDKRPPRGHAAKLELPLAWLLLSRGKKSSHALIRSGSAAPPPPPSSWILPPPLPSSLLVRIRLARSGFE